MRHDTALTESAAANQWKPAGPIMPVTSEKPHAGSIAAHQHTIPIVLDFMQPASPAGGFAAGLGRQGSQKSGKATRRNNMPKTNGIFLARRFLIVAVRERAAVTAQRYAA